MKQILLALFVLTSVSVLGQNNSTNKTVDLTIVGSLVANKATVREVTDKFGQATEELARPESTLLQYKSNDNVYLFTFNENRKLYDFIFDNQSKNLPDRLTYSDIKQARTSKTKAEIQKKLGQPTKIIIHDQNETWYYSAGDEAAPQKTLIIGYDLTSPTIVKSYNYYANFDSVAPFSSEVINSFIKGSTSSADIERKLGKPSKIIMSNESENWFYTSKKSTLIVYFDKQSKINDFLFQRSSN